MDYSAQLEELKEELKTYRQQRLQIIKTGQSWSLKNGDDSRAITNVSLVQLNAIIKETERKIEALEALISGNVSHGAVRLVAEV